MNIIWYYEFNSALKRTRLVYPLQSFSCTSVEFIFTERAMTFIFLLFLKLFAGTVHLCQGTVVTRVPMRLSRNSSLKHWRLAHFRGVNCLCRTRVVKKQLLAATVFANRARREGLPGVYLAKASGEPSIAKENNYPFAVRISCGTHTIKINIGSPRPHLCFAFMRAIKQYIIFSPKMIKRELSIFSIESICFYVLCNI